MRFLFDDPVRVVPADQVSSAGDLENSGIPSSAESIDKKIRDLGSFT